MSLNIGNNQSKYVGVYDVSIKFAFSEKATFAKLRTSAKTNKPKLDENGEAVFNEETGKPVMERKTSHWEGIFVGNAFEPSKTLSNGTLIDITSGWIEQNTGSNGKTYLNVYISDFELSDATRYQEAYPHGEDE
jgi:hypothetical protein